MTTNSGPQTSAMEDRNAGTLPFVSPRISLVAQSSDRVKAAIEVTSRRTRLRFRLQAFRYKQTANKPGFDDKILTSRRQMCTLVCGVLECAFEGLMDGPTG